MAQKSTSVTVGDTTTVTPLTTAADELVLHQSANTPHGPDGCAAISGGSGTVAFATAVISIQGRLNSNGKWRKLAVIDRSDNTTKSGNISLTDDTPFDFFIPNTIGYDDIKIVLESIGSGKVVVEMESFPAAFAPALIMGPTLAVATTAQLINVSSATAFNVGPNGATNPTLTVVTNTASGATGVSITNQAEGSRAVIGTLSSGAAEGITINAKGAASVRLGAGASNTAVEFSAPAVPTSSDGVALGSATLQWSDLFLAEGGVINWDNGDATITQTNNVIAFAGITSITVAGAATPATNDAGALGSTTLGWSDLHLATGGVINWANGEVTITEEDANTLTVAGATAVKLGAVTLNVTGTRIVTSYHTNLVSTNAVTVDSSETVKQNINPYKGDALETIRKMDVITYRHKGHLDNGQVKLGLRAESVNEPLAVDRIVRSEEDGGGDYPGVNLYSLAAVQTRAIQQLNEKIDRLERRAVAA